MRVYLSSEGAAEKIYFTRLADINIGFVVLANFYKLFRVHSPTRVYIFILCYGVNHKIFKNIIRVYTYTPEEIQQFSPWRVGR